MAAREVGSTGFWRHPASVSDSLTRSLDIANAWKAPVADLRRPAFVFRYGTGLDRSKGKPADRYHGIETHHPASGQPVDVEIHLVGGAPHIRTFDVDGNRHLQPLQRRRINRRQNRQDRDYRISAEYDVITDPTTGETDGYVRIRLDQTAQDRMSGYNRPEHLRAFPETDPVFADIQRPLRSSAESANRTIDDPLPRERLHHFGFEKNQLSMLAWQTYRNSQTEAVFAPSHVGHAGTPPPLERTG